MGDMKFDRSFSMASCPRNGTVVTVMYNGEEKKVFWVRDSRYGKAGGYYTDNTDKYPPESFEGWKA